MSITIPTTEPPLLSRSQAAALLGVSDFVVKRLEREGQVEAVRVGGSVRIRRSSLDKFLGPYAPQSSSSQPPVAA